MKNRKPSIQRLGILLIGATLGMPMCFFAIGTMPNSVIPKNE
jgi:hypothetical protein